MSEIIKKRIVSYKDVWEFTLFEDQINKIGKVTSEWSDRHSVFEPKYTFIKEVKDYINNNGVKIISKDTRSSSYSKTVGVSEIILEFDNIDSAMFFKMKWG